MESAGLSDYAKHCLREICSQEWVREKFLKETDQLFTADLLLDKMLSHRQVIILSYLLSWFSLKILTSWESPMWTI